MEPNPPPESTDSTPDQRASASPEQPSESAPDAPQPESAPSFGSVQNFLLYGLSVPERALRSTSALVGGAMKESAMLLVPQAFRSSRSYSMFIQQMLDFMVNDVGGVERTEAGPSTTEVEGYVAKKAVSSFLDLATLATLHISPMTVLALFSDIAYGSQEYLQELSLELKAQGVIAEDSTIDHAADLLNAIQEATGNTAQALDMPPLSVEGLRETIAQTQQTVSQIDPTKVLPQSEMQRLWREMHEVAERDKVSVMEVAGAMSLFTANRIGDVSRGTLSSLVVAGNMFDRHILDHYTDGLSDIYQKGFYASLAESSQPYFEAVWTNFSTDKTTLTEDVLTGRLFNRAWSGMKGWWASDENSAESDSAESDSAESDAATSDANVAAADDSAESSGDEGASSSELDPAEQRPPADASPDDGAP